MTKAVTYARVSSKEQEKEGFSIPAQLDLLKAYALKNEIEIAEEFIDVETAKQAGRNSFNQMICYLKEMPSIKTILCEKTDRLYRNFRDFVTVDDLDLTIHLVKEGEVLSEDSKSHQKFIHGIKLLMAKNYIDNLSEEVKKGHAKKAELGEYPSVAPIGYHNNRETHKIEIDPVKAPVIKKLFELYSLGTHSLRDLSSIAKAENLIGKRGSYVSKSRIQRMLNNPIYIGDFVWKGEYYSGIHPKIISKELFNQVQGIMAGKKGRKGSKKDFAFSGLIRCGHCGCSITAEI